MGTAATIPRSLLKGGQNFLLSPKGSLSTIKRCGQGFGVGDNVFADVQGMPGIEIHGQGQDLLLVRVIIAGIWIEIHPLESRIVRESDTRSGSGY